MTSPSILRRGGLGWARTQLPARTNRHRLFRGGHRQANAALYRIVIVRMRWHQPTLDYVTRRTGQGLSKKDIIRCLKRFVAREIYNALIDDHRSRAARSEVA